MVDVPLDRGPHPLKRFPELRRDGLLLGLGFAHHVGELCAGHAILFVRWLGQRNLIVQVALCGLTIPAVTELLMMIVRLGGLNE